MRLSLLAIFLLAGVVSTASGQLYKWVDQDGKVTYSDVPPPKDAKDAKQKSFSDNITPGESDLPYSVKDAMKRNPVTLYANACGEVCDQARAMLNARGIPFADLNPETNKVAYEKLKEAAGGRVPTLMIGTQVLSGFLESGWQDALSSAGYPLNNPRPIRPAATPARPAAAPTPTTPAPAPSPAPAPAPAK